MKNITKTVGCGIVAVLSGCSSKPQDCEQLLDVLSQQRECQMLIYQIQHNQNPQQVTEARRRFDQACTEFRYYRDEYETICPGHDMKIDEIKQPDNSGDGAN